ncbi:F-box/kelch-repeat protein At5g15710-like [Cryptomeria japonica]|uniref:F-box/kelch-repeat protein At5g15710-like n=1 Tax=Cryptomeria japonica TaxID=3369 RepID=UPI0025ACE617|nr:F-box/kelch-repeat protein At5g15710-like [Cryptomeria japonica]
MDRESVTSVERDGEGSDISKLPQDMKEMVFAKLSFESIYGSRAVCKEWNSILSSYNFLSSLPTQNPWLLIYGKKIDGNRYYMAYHFSAQKWMTLPLSFLPNLQRGNVKDLAGWGQGLLLFQETPTPQLFICNPLMRSYAELKIKLTNKFIRIVQGGKKGPYLVVCPHSKIFSFKIYHYFQDSWKIKLQFAAERGSNISGHRLKEMVQCNDALFWMGWSPETIVGYKIKDEGFIKPVTVAPLPPEIVQPRGHILSMVSYGKSVLVVGSTRRITTLQRLGRSLWLFRGIVIWELFEDEGDELVWKWKEFARMPQQSIPQHLDPTSIGQCVCVGDYLCFSLVWSWKSPPIFAYNLKGGFWQRLPPCTNHYHEQMKMMSFEPKLNNYHFLGKSRE